MRGQSGVFLSLHGGAVSQLDLPAPHCPETVSPGLMLMSLGGVTDMNLCPDTTHSVI